MKWMQGDLIDVAQAEGCNAIGFTANGVVAQDERLVMGAGAAKRIRDYFPGVDAKLGSKINFLYGVDPTKPYQTYHCVSVKIKDKWICAVQVKQHYKDHESDVSKEACWDLTRVSLNNLANSLKRHSEISMVMNCPLIGHGGYVADSDRVKAMVEEILGSTDIRVCLL